MARGRIITNAITGDKSVNDLSSDTCRLALTWLITYADKEGRTHGNPAMVRALLFPRRDDVTMAQMKGFIQEWKAAGFVQWYEADGDQWISFVNFAQNQPGMRKDKEPDSRIPAPPPLPGASPETAEPQDIPAMDASDPPDGRQADADLPEDVPPKRMERNGRESSGEKLPERPPTGRNATKAVLEEFFSTETGIPRPNAANAKRRKAASVRWWQPLLEIAALVEDDTERAKAIIHDAIAQMDKDALTVAAPQSILEVARSIHGKNQRGASDDVLRVGM